MRSRAWFAALAFAALWLALPQAALAQSGTNVQGMGTAVLRVVFGIGGVAAAAAGAVSGVRLIASSALSSGYGVSQAVGSVVVALIGLALMISGPAIAGEIVRTTAVSPSFSGMGDWSKAANAWIRILTQLAAVIAAVGIAWNAVQFILDAAFGGSGELSAEVMGRILGCALALALALAAPGITTGLAGVIR
ncbi:MAG: hypothetical protein ACUVSX_16615 [Aggregatilineales bacterium]